MDDMQSRIATRLDLIKSKQTETSSEFVCNDQNVVRQIFKTIKRLYHI